ncbi:hypothetical protein GH714_009556 [Hevea brasiliensis]|uniref:Uncharacterized protein n=1 Tax=Hevea brasiliensis TaxID=3981 RepID=A0A6A6KZ84_HEVBR|nr:hypothetical protein GH714_009556 [Hevea brasiliensis]
MVENGTRVRKAINSGLKGKFHGKGKIGVKASSRFLVLYDKVVEEVVDDFTGGEDSRCEWALNDPSMAMAKKEKPILKRIAGDNKPSVERDKEGFLIPIWLKFSLNATEKGKHTVAIERVGSKVVEQIIVVDRAKPQIEYALHSGDYTNLADSKLLQMNYNEKEMKIRISCAAACVYKPLSSSPKMNQWNFLGLPTGIHSTLSNGAQGPDPSFQDPTPTNGRYDPLDARLPNGGGLV